MSPPLKGVLFDRDGTIVVDVPYNGDPDLVQPVPGAREVLDRLRAAGVKVGVLTNQSGVGRAMITEAKMREVNARVDELLGPFDGWFVCPHSPADDCECRKPKPKLVLDAAAQWGLDPSDIVVIGDKESDVEAAENAGARAIRIDESHSLMTAIDEALTG
ncbi:MAG TPA: HAD family hydrolase [Candidatus Baltobacteraceae bacterium]|nr:HAD family hydrolase [Candidatus Baltobacteraceae bacterium]